MEIARVKTGSIAERHGLRVGERLMRINQRAVRDSLDYLYLASEETILVEVESAGGRRRTIEIEKETDEDIGLVPVPDPIRQCPNRCLFCFVDQLPKGLRRSLYVKDEDYRLSFLHGNYITLTNLEDEDFERIGEQRLTPLYVSVHATEPEVRARLLRNPRAAEIMKPLGRLAAMRIAVHAQIVLCPGINDGPHLERTVRDLLSLYPCVQSVAIIPVGLTRHREGLRLLNPCTRETAQDLIPEVEAWQRAFLRSAGTRGVFLADEFYLLAGRPFPPVADFEALAQAENGVGLTPVFLAELASLLPSVSSSELRRVKAALVTGELMRDVLDHALAEPIREAGGACTVIPVRNRFLGETVTVSGLLAGSDIARALGDLEPSLRVLLPPNSVSTDGLFIDGKSPAELRDGLALELAVAPKGTEALLGQLTRMGG